MVTETQKVDVLAVLNTAAKDWNASSASKARAADAAHDVVSDLIKAATRAAIAAVRGDDNHPGTIRNKDLDELRAAIARIGGGA